MEGRRRNGESENWGGFGLAKAVSVPVTSKWKRGEEQKFGTNPDSQN